MSSTAPITAPKMLHSIYGRKFGLDVNGFEVSAENAVIAATSATTATAISYGGVQTLSSASATWAMSPPVPGISVFVQRLSTSTGTTGVINLSTGVTVITSSQSTATVLTFTGSASIWMLGLSTSQYAATIAGVTLA